MDKLEPFAMYRFQGFKFEFIKDYVLVTDEANMREFRIELIHYSECPFVILMEKR